MGCAPVNRRSGRWRLASLLALTALAAGAASADPGRPVLVFPARAPAALAGVAEAVTRALPGELARAGCDVMLVSPDSPWVAAATREGWMAISEVEAGRLEDHRYALALLAKAEVVFTGEVTEEDTRAVLNATVAGVVAQQPTALRVTAARAGAPGAVGQELAHALRASLTRPVWEALRTDPEGRRQGAAARYAAGQREVEAGRWSAAALAFELACAGDPDRAEYLEAAARALDAWGRSEVALTRARRAAQLQPDDPEYTRTLGEIALHAGRFEQAQAAFLQLLRAAPEDPGALEGAARTLRARGDAEGARQRYLQLLRVLPALRQEPTSLAAILSTAKEESFRFAGAPTPEVDRALARFYFDAGQYASGVIALHRYYKGGEAPAASDAEYTAQAEGLDEEAVRLAREAEAKLPEPRLTEAEIEAAENVFEAIHDRSERLADVGEWIRVSPRLEAAHRFRVLAYNALNESDFEALLFVRTNDTAHRRRAALLREASRTALQEAVVRQNAARAPAPASAPSPAGTASSPGDATQ